MRGSRLRTTETLGSTNPVEYTKTHKGGVTGALEKEVTVITRSGDFLLKTTRLPKIDIVSLIRNNRVGSYLITVMTHFTEVLKMDSIALLQTPRLLHLSTKQ